MVRLLISCLVPKMSPLKPIGLIKFYNRLHRALGLGVKTVIEFPRLLGHEKAPGAKNF